MPSRNPLVDDRIMEQFQIKRLGLDELVAESDSISLHAPLTEATRGLVDRKFLARMRPGSLLSGHLAGASLDVLKHEPPEPGNPLLGLPTVVFSPHIAGTDLQSMSDVAELAARTVVELYHNRWPAACVVNGDVRLGWRW